MLDTGMDRSAGAPVLVAGGGPAGLLAARRLAEAGVPVTVFERESEIGSPVHTSGASWIREMRAYGVPERCYRPIPRLRFVGPSTQAELAWSEPVGCIVDVRALYQHLAERAIAAGAEIRLRSTVTGPLLRDGRVAGLRVRPAGARESELAAPLVVDATGFAAGVARGAGLHEGFRRYGLGAEYDVYAPNADPDEVLVWLGATHAPAGYGWLAPYAEGRFRVGVGVLRPDVAADPRAVLERAIASLPLLRRALRGASAVESHLGYIPSQGMPERWIGDGLLCVGDAAGHPSALLGEGIRYALHSGSLGGAVAAQALGAGDVSRARLSAFAREWERRHGRDLRRALGLNRILASLSDASLDLGVTLLGRLPPAAAAALLRGERAGLASALWRGAAQPRLAGAILARAGRRALRAGGRGAVAEPAPS
jgi:digeranylgeranylglycerophospholipid reductase